jgi:hypothetical protein
VPSGGLILNIDFVTVARQHGKQRRQWCEGGTMDELRIIAAPGMVGYGFPEASPQAALEQDPHIVGSDGGSCDPGPCDLGAGVSFTARKAVKRNIELMLTGALRYRISLILGSASGVSGAPHLAWTRQIIEEIVQEQGLHFRMAIVHADQDKRDILRQITAGQDQTLGTCANTNRA